MRLFQKMFQNLLPTQATRAAKFDNQKARLAAASPQELQTIFASTFVQNKTGILARLGLRKKEVPSVIAALAQLHQESRFNKGQDRPPNHADVWHNARNFVTLRPNLYLVPSFATISNRTTASQDIAAWQNNVFKNASAPAQNFVLGGHKSDNLLPPVRLAQQPLKTPSVQHVPPHIGQEAQAAQYGVMPQQIPVLKQVKEPKIATIWQLAPFEVHLTPQVAEVVYPQSVPTDK
jgi:hypothetical protein